MTKLLLIAFASSAIVLGCAPQSSVTSQPQTFNAHQELVAASFSYQFDEAGCSTGRQSFDDHADLCRGLRDEKLNGNCAFDQRRAAFEQECR